MNLVIPDSFVTAWQDHNFIVPCQPCTPSTTGGPPPPESGTSTADLHNTPAKENS